MDKLLQNFNYNMRFTKSDGCVLINPKNWIANTTNIVQGFSVDGKSSMNYIAEVLKTNVEEDLYGTPVKENDYVLLTRAASKVSYLKPFEVPYGIDKWKFSSIHILQVIGKFTNNIVDLEHLTPLFDKVIMEPVKIDISETIYAGEAEVTSVGRVLKVGDGGFTSKWKRRPMNISVDDTVLLRENITTKINFDNKDYLCTDDNMIVGKFKDNVINIDNIQLYNNYLLMEELDTEAKLLGSSLLYAPVVDLDKEDISEVYQRDKFKIINKSNAVKDFEIGDSVIISRDKVNYIIFKGKKYFMVNDVKDIEGKIED